MSRWQLIAFGACLAGLGCAPATVQAADTAPKACASLPLQELEALYGTKPGPARATGGGSLSICKVSFGKNAVELHTSPAGTVGTPRTIQEGLAIPRMVGQQANSPLKYTEIKDLGKFGCTTAVASEFLGQKAGQSVYTTSCFVVEGGYLNLILTHEDPKRVAIETVRRLTEKAATSRK